MDECARVCVFLYFTLLCVCLYALSAPDSWYTLPHPPLFTYEQEKKETSRKQIKEAKNRGLKIRGTGRRIAKHKAKKAAK